MPQPDAETQRQIECLLQPLEVARQREYYTEVGAHLLARRACMLQNGLRCPTRECLAHWRQSMATAPSMTEPKHLSKQARSHIPVQLLPPGLAIQYEGDDSKGKRLVADTVSIMNSLGAWRPGHAGRVSMHH